MRVRAFVATAVAAFTICLTAPAYAQLGGRTAEEWINTLETNQRLASLKIPETLKALGLKPGMMWPTSAPAPASSRRAWRMR